MEKQQIEEDVRLAQGEVLHGRIDELGRVLLPVIVVASDGLELEIEAAITLQFAGAMAVHEDVARRLGWRRLGARRVTYGFDTVLMDHYLGTISLGAGVEPSQYVVIGGIKESAVIGQKLLSGRQLKIDFVDSRVLLE